MTNYKEPEFKVVLTSAQDVLTSSSTTPSGDPFETNLVWNP